MVLNIALFNIPVFKRSHVQKTSCVTLKCLSGPGTNSLAEVRLADGQTCKVRLVVGADGARSRTRQLAGEKALFL